MKLPPELPPDADYGNAFLAMTLAGFAVAVVGLALATS
jgi:hypothetical protein